MVQGVRLVHFVAVSLHIPYRRRCFAFFFQLVFCFLGIINLFAFYQRGEKKTPMNRKNSNAVYILLAATSSTFRSNKFFLPEIFQFFFHLSWKEREKKQPAQGEDLLIDFEHSQINFMFFFWLLKMLKSAHQPTTCYTPLKFDVRKWNLMKTQKPFFAVVLLLYFVLTLDSWWWALFMLAGCCCCLACGYTSFISQREIENDAAAAIASPKI